jgi:hypothetical protein
VQVTAIAALGLATVTVGSGAGAAPSPRPIVYTNAYGTYAVRPDGTGWRQLNECTLDPLTTNGRQLIGGFNHLSDPSAPLVLLPATREVVNDCDSGPRDPSVLPYRLRVKGSQVSAWNSLAWSPDGRRIVAVGQLGSGYAANWRAVVFNKNGSGYRALAPRLDGVHNNVSGVAWSPRGDRIVFGRTFKTSDCPEFVETKTIEIGCSRAELAVMDADGSNARSLYRPPQIEESQVEYLPQGSALRKLPNVLYRPFAWHGTRIFVLTHEDVSARRDDFSERIAVIGEDGKGFRYLTPPGTVDAPPALSPDGKQIAWIWLPGCTKGQPQAACTRSSTLYVMNSSGGGIRKVSIRQPLTSATCSRGSLPGRKTCTQTNIGFSQVAW